MMLFSTPLKWRTLILRAQATGRLRLYCRLQPCGHPPLWEGEEVRSRTDLSLKVRILHCSGVNKDTVWSVAVVGEHLTREPIDSSPLAVSPLFFSDKPTCSWSKKEVLTLLTHWANPAVQQELSRNVRNNAVYSSLSAKLASLGYNKTAQKCKEKLKKLKQDYRRIKNSNHLDGGKNIWFDIIDQVLGASVQKRPETPKLPSAEPALPVLFEENCQGNQK